MTLLFDHGALTMPCPSCGSPDSKFHLPTCPHLGDRAIGTHPPIQDTLAERGARYGEWKDHAARTEQLLYAMEADADRNTDNWERLAPYQRQALRVIADKIARILNGDPNYDDNWRDIAGYATLVLERLPNAVPPTEDSMVYMHQGRRISYEKAIELGLISA